MQIDGSCIIEEEEARLSCKTFKTISELQIFLFLHEAGVIIIVDVDAIDDVVVVVEPTELSVFQGQLWQWVRV